MSIENAKRLLNQALTSMQGITISFPNEREAKAMRTCCYSARQRDRKLSTKIHGANSPQANRSPWDSLTLDFDVEALTLTITPGEEQLLSLKVVDNETGEEVEL